MRFPNRSIARQFRLGDLSTDSLRWTMGFFCGLVGAFILVAPHHFGAPVYAALRPYSSWWGTLSLTAGVALMAVEILRPRRWIVLLVHGLLGAALLGLAASFAWVQGWTGLISYTILGLGTIFAGLRPRTRVPLGEGGDLFALLMGMLATVAGAVQVLTPGVFQNPYYDPIRPFLLPLGLGLLLIGPLLSLAQLRPPLSRSRLAALHLFSGLVFISYGVFSSIPLRAWTGIPLYWGCGTAVALLPRLRRHLDALDTSTLRTRLGLALGVATSLSLILATAIVTHQEERLVEEQVREALRIEAEAIARNVDDYVELSGARTYAVAALAGRIAMTEPAQRELLLGSRQAYPDVAAFRTLDARGAVVAGVGRVQLPPRLLREMAEEMRRKAQVQLQLVRIKGSSLLLMTAPVQRQRRELGGLIVAVFDSKWLARRIVRPGSNVHLGDGRGHLIAHQDTAAGGLPELPQGWDRRVRAGATLQTEDGIVSTARVPDLNWIVAVERSRADALSGVRRGRDTAFLLLLLVVPLAVAGGIATARRITRPLGTLADAVDQMAAGNPGAPLGSSGITEVARLSSAFREMRDRLAARTRERERLSEELRARADALAESDRRKDEFLAMLAHELRNPLGAISNASYLMEQLGPTDPQMVRAVSIVRRQVQHLVRLVDDLLDVSRITRGKVELRRERIDLREVARHAVEMTRPLFDQRGHELRVELPGEPLILEADATRLEQVLANLLRNAAKYTDPGGRIDLAVHRDGTAALVSVRDNGIGIAPDLLPRVFELFAQGEQSLDRSGAGLGIGLTLVRSLVEMHGGTVEARSDGLGKGAEFTVHLPLAV
ncbi:MAG TPA: sensor histidine kinase [Thermoanaerobaculia bacterium]|nr:sensor histidine kinase [Thermoanaerobaculia bacterium]